MSENTAKVPHADIPPLTPGMIGRRCPDCLAYVPLGTLHACRRAA